MRSIRKISVLCLAVALATGLGFAGAGYAKKSKKAHVASRVSFKAAGPEGFSGKVKAKSKDCRAQRQVLIYRVNSQGTSPSNVPFGSTWTNSKGAWSLPGPQSPGAYWAQVKKKKLPKRKGGRVVICKTAYSNGAIWG